MNKKVILAALACALVVTVVVAGTVTQTASSINENLHRDKWWSVGPTALSKLVKTDVPAIITELNSRDTSQNVQTNIVNKYQVYAPDTHANLTNGATITPTAPYMKIQANELGTSTVANASYAGQILILENIAATNIVIADNGTTMALGADAVLGATDTLMLIANATNQWRELSLSDN